MTVSYLLPMVSLWLWESKFFNIINIGNLSPYRSVLNFSKIKFDELYFLSISNMNFAGYTGSKVYPTWFSKSIFQNKKYQMEINRVFVILWAVLL